MKEIPKIPKGQPFSFHVPLIILNSDGTKEKVVADQVTDIAASLQCACETIGCEYLTYKHYIVLNLSAELKVQEYAVIITATLPTGRPFALRIKRAFEIVQWDSQSNWRDYIIGDAIVPEDTPLIAGVFNSDEEWERLKEELRLQIASAQAAEAAAEAAKREWEQKAAELDDVAQEATLTQGVQDIRADIAGIDIDTSDLAKEATLQQVIDANILRPNLQGFTFNEGWATDNVSAILAYVKNKMRGELYSEMTMPIAPYAFYGCSSLTSANFPNATSIGVSAFQSCTGLTSANFPNVTSIENSMFIYCNNLTFANFLSLHGQANNAFSYCHKLIDLHIGRLLNVSLNFRSMVWDPTIAYSDGLQNLVPAAVLELHPEWVNRDYLLYCLREHFAANLPDRTGQTALTITFSATMKTHINNSPETVAAFTDKNWIIA